MTYTNVTRDHVKLFVQCADIVRAEVLLAPIRVKIPCEQPYLLPWWQLVEVCHLVDEFG
jgi:hypothetical protein